MICAEQCRRNERIGKLLDRIVADNNNPIDELQFVNLDQSMAGGGGPACLRMRLQLPADEVHGFAGRYRLTPERIHSLREVIERTYPDALQWEALPSDENLERYRLAYQALNQWLCA